MSTKLSVLLLEDDPSSIRLFNRKLQTAPVEIVVRDVRNKEGFLRELETPNFDCVVIDYTLPDINGLEALRLVKEMAPGTPTIIYTGSVGEEKAVECMKEGASEFLLKTNSIRLVSAILSVVNQRREHEARLHAEEAQKQSEARFHTLVEASSAIITIYQNNQLVFINPFAEQITGYTIDELKQMNFLDLIHPEHREIVRQYEIARQNGENAPARFEFKIIRKDGEERWLDFAVATIQHENNLAILGIAFDATFRKVAEELLQSSEQRYRTLFEANPNPMWLFDADTLKFIAVNDSAVNHYGYSRDEFLSMKIKDIIPLNDVETLDEHLKQSMETEGLYKCILCKHKKKNGEVIEVEAISHALQFDGHNARMVLTMDVTERRRTEEALKASEANYRSLFESARDVIFTLSLEGIITALNPVFELTTRWKCDEWIGRHIYEIIHPDDKTRASEAMQRVLSGGPSHYNEYRVRKKNGDYMIAEIRVTLQIRNDENVGLLGIARDVTNQKKLERQFRQAQKMESIGTLAGGIAHDFNNIMGIVYAYLALTEQHANDADKLKLDIEMIRNASDRAAALVRQLLTFARKSSVVIELIDVHTLIVELAPMLEATFPKTIEIVLNLDETIPSINADKNQLHQALLNIAVNARDAMPNGGVLRFKSEVVDGEKLKNKIPDVKAGEYVHIAVIDNGCGMDDETRSKAFDPFFTRKEKGKGTGLGLAVVYGIAGSHDGFVDIESEINKGTTVHIYIPASPIKKSINQPTDELKDIKGGKETILIVEDESPLRFYLRLIFAAKGYEILEASNGAEGVKVFEKNKNQIKLVVSDFGMPKLDGLGLLKKIREIQPTAKLMMTSGFITPEQRIEILQAGAIDIITKPFKPNEILQRIREILDLAN